VYKELYRLILNETYRSSNLYCPKHYELVPKWLVLTKAKQLVLDIIDYTQQNSYSSKLQCHKFPYLALYQQLHVLYLW